MVSWGRYLVWIPLLPLSITGASQVLLPERDCILHPRHIHFDCRGEEKGSHPNDVTPLHRDCSHVTLLFLELYQGWMFHYGPHGCLRCPTSGKPSVHICASPTCAMSLLLSDPCATTQLAKMIKYMGGTLSCDIVFGLFMVAWFITRHILFMLVIASIYVDMPKFSSLRWDPPNGYYVSTNIYIGFLVLMSLLQVGLIIFSPPLNPHELSCVLGTSTDLVLYNFESCVQGYNRTRS